MEQRHRSETREDEEYDKENIGHHLLSPQPCRASYLPRIQRFKDRTKKTLILDLDETLVHSQFEKHPSPDIVLPVIFEGKQNHIYIKVRPGAIDFLRKINKFFEVVIFTASVANYADPLIDILDVDGYEFYKLFREH
jgi:carboxy-terminal domain RNA polymerase II polypeptide A small phosphatase